MIHHLSIPAEDPALVSKVLAAMLGGHVTRFGPYQGSFIAWAGDEHGSAIEVYPAGTEMFPDAGRGQANFRHNPSTSGFVATHATVSLSLTTDEILAVAKQHGWRAL